MVAVVEDIKECTVVGDEEHLRVEVGMGRDIAGDVIPV